MHGTASGRRLDQGCVGKDPRCLWGDNGCGYQCMHTARSQFDYLAIFIAIVAIVTIVDDFVAIGIQHGAKELLPGTCFVLPSAPDLLALPISSMI